jgi:anti-sigma-K factor RskA
MNVHEQFAEDLALYAIGALAGDEKTSLEKHLEQCASCRRELEQLRGDSALLALTASGPRPPARSRARLMSALGKEPRVQRARTRTHWWMALGWLAAAFLIIVAATLWKQNKRLSSTVVNFSGMMERQRLDLEQARREADILKAPDATTYEILPVSFKAPPQPGGKAIYSPQRGGLIFIASNLKPLPAQKSYELWLIPAQGAPIPAGVFKPNARGSATITNPPLPAGVEAKAFAITVEPEQGSSTPTMPIVMMGAGG